MSSTRRDIGAYIKSAFSSAGTDVTAGGAGDATEVNGAWIDRQGFLSCKAIVVFTATLAEGETLSIVANGQDATSSVGAGAADYGDALAATVVATGGAGGSTETGTVELDFDLSGANQYFRLQFTPDLSAETTDTAEIASVVILGGGETLPSGNRAN